MHRSNIPNILTLFRILLIPVLVVLLLTAGRSADLAAAIVFMVASVTDFIDGYLARSQNAVTSFGKLMDPIADKLLVISALFCLVIVDRLALWIAIVIVGRELAVTLSRMIIRARGTVVPAARAGKLKTVIQLFAILMLIALDPTPLWVDILVYSAVVITLISGVDYMVRVRRPTQSTA